MSDPHEVIKQLSPQDALSVLRALIDRDERIATLAAEIAIEHLSSIDPEAIAFELYDQLNALEVEEVWDRAGPTRYGYVDPGEAADQMVDEVVEPYLNKLKRFYALGMNAQANQLCIGLLLGLHRFGQESTSVFKDWAPDAPSGFAWAEIGDYLKASRQLTAQDDHLHAVTCFEILYELIDTMENGEEIVFADEIGSWMIPGDEKEYIAAYMTSLAATMEPEEFAEAAIPLIRRDSWHSLTAQVYKSAISAADGEQRERLEAEVQRQEIRTERWW